MGANFNVSPPSVFQKLMDAFSRVRRDQAERDVLVHDLEKTGKKKRREKIK
jgi:hypothetical protein